MVSTSMGCILMSGSARACGDQRETHSVSVGSVAIRKCIESTWPNRILDYYKNSIGAAGTECFKAVKAVMPPTAFCRRRGSGNP